MSFRWELVVDDLSWERAYRIAAACAAPGSLSLHPGAPSEGPFFKRREREPRLDLDEMDGGPVERLADEALEHEDGWPQDQNLATIFGETMRRIAMHAPSTGFAFQAGWEEHFPPKHELHVSLDELLRLIDHSSLRSDTRYHVAAT